MRGRDLGGVGRARRHQPGLGNLVLGSLPPARRVVEAHTELALRAWLRRTGLIVDETGDDVERGQHGARPDEEARAGHCVRVAVLRDLDSAEPRSRAQASPLDHGRVGEAQRHADQRLQIGDGCRLVRKEAIVDEPLAELGEPTLLVGQTEGTFERDLIARGPCADGDERTRVWHRRPNLVVDALEVGPREGDPRRQIPEVGKHGCRVAGWAHGTNPEIVDLISSIAWA